VPSLPTPKGRTLKQCAADFLTLHENLPHRAEDSLGVYTLITSGFLALTDATYPKDVTQDDVIRWHGWMRQTKKYGDRTCSNRYKSLRGFLRYCGLNPSSIIDAGTHKMLKQYTRKVVNTYTLEVVNTLIKHSMDENRALLWDFMYKTGLRDSEVQAVTRYDLHGLDTDAPMLHVKERDEYGRIKDAEERTVELHPSLVEPIKTWMKKHPTKVLLFGTVNDCPDTKMLLALKLTARRAGLNCGYCKGCLGSRNECREFTLHRFRRTFTTRLLRATGGDLRSVMARTGHSDLTSVMRYLEPAAHIRAAVATAF
jgi:integrase